MADTSFPIRADGFTPVFDEVVRDVGTVGAVVFGVVYRHCRMRYGRCFASVPTMAKLTGLSRQTLDRWLPELCKRGWLRCTNPEATGVPHEYVDTGRMTLLLKAEATEPNPGQRVEGEPADPRLRVESTLDLESRLDGPTLDLESNKETKDQGNHQDTTDQTEAAVASSTDRPSSLDGDVASPILKELIDLGMAGPVAKKWLGEIGPDGMAGWLRYVEGRDNVANKPAYLVSIWQSGQRDPPAGTAHREGDPWHTPSQGPPPPGWTTCVEIPDGPGEGREYLIPSPPRDLEGYGTCACFRYAPLCDICGQCDFCCECEA